MSKYEQTEINLELITYKRDINHLTANKFFDTKLDDKIFVELSWLQPSQVVSVESMSWGRSFITFILVDEMKEFYGYAHGEKVIVPEDVSITTLIHECYHALEFLSDGESVTDNVREKNARLAEDAFFLAMCYIYRHRGRAWHITHPNDLVEVIPE